MVGGGVKMPEKERYVISERSPSSYYVTLPAVRTAVALCLASLLINDHRTVGLAVYDG